MARSYVSRAKRDAGAKSGKFRKMTQSSSGGSYDGKPAEDDPRFNPKRDGNRRSGLPPQFPVDRMKKRRA